jgi:6-phosphogluconate dehydrogenase
MQLIAEAYDILKRGLGLNENEIADIFLKWNKGVLDSFLIEITANILKFKDDDGEPVLNKILDKAGQKGTGKWTAIAALDAGTAGGSHRHLFCVSSCFTVNYSHPDWGSRFCALLVFD